MLKSYFPYYKRLLALASPLVLTQAGQMIVQLVDTAMVGRVGTTELAAASFAGSIFTIVMIFGIGIFIGITPLISFALGAKEDKKVTMIIKNGLVLTVIIILFLTSISLSLSFFMNNMGQPDEVWQMAIPYFRLLSYSLIPLLLFMMLKQIGEGLNNTMLAMIATILSNILNIILNYILIFGKFGFPPMGLIGAGYATLISRIIMPIILFTGFIYVAKIRHYFKLFSQVKIRVSEIFNILKVGFPISIQLVIEMLLFAVGTIMMGWLGDVPLAAHQVAIGLAGFTFMIANGVAMATTIRVSYQLGIKAYESMERVSLSAIHIVLTFMSISGIFFLIFREQLPLLFSTDQNVIDQAAALLMAAALFQIFDGIQVTCLGILRGFADVKIPVIIAAISYLGVGLPASYITAFVLDIGPIGIWYGFIAGLATAAILLYLRIRVKIKEVEGI